MYVFHRENIRFDRKTCLIHKLSNLKTNEVSQLFELICSTIEFLINFIICSKIN